eukprot:TRINITY_DN8593_c0_g1_i2.p1 TRINITY_DN8593_c0_g1~~TRINITY_DN8593_c0_g1_i2.p1  ORF type:complete len:512 (-),score=11.73 TRINITY_DN8593_c0_g1_i2:137-1672(-)
MCRAPRPQVQPPGSQAFGGTSPAAVFQHTPQKQLRFDLAPRQLEFEALRNLAQSYPESGSPPKPEEAPIPRPTWLYPAAAHPSASPFPSGAPSTLSHPDPFPLSDSTGQSSSAQDRPASPGDYPLDPAEESSDFCSPTTIPVDYPEFCVLQHSSPAAAAHPTSQERRRPERREDQGHPNRSVDAHALYPEGSAHSADVQTQQLLGLFRRLLRALEQSESSGRPPPRTSESGYPSGVSAPSTDHDLATRGLTGPSTCTLPTTEAAMSPVPLEGSTNLNISSLTASDGPTDRGLGPRLRAAEKGTQTTPRKHHSSRHRSSSLTSPSSVAPPSPPMPFSGLSPSALFDGPPCACMAGYPSPRPWRPTFQEPRIPETCRCLSDPYLSLRSFGLTRWRSRLNATFPPLRSPLLGAGPLSHHPRNTTTASPRPWPFSPPSVPLRPPYSHSSLPNRWRSVSPPSQSTGNGPYRAPAWAHRLGQSSAVRTSHRATGRGVPFDPRWSDIFSSDSDEDPYP